MPDEKIYLLIEGTKGFTIDDNGITSLKDSISLTNAYGKILTSNENLFPELVIATNLGDQLYRSITMSKASVKNPITCGFKIHDRQSNKYLENCFKLTVTN